RREVLLPQGLSIDKVDASFSKGVLTIILPKSPMEKSKKIEIKNK
ncbi:MAG: Hsp20/alpha crystallin family protein, partial [Deltaproteobacteria bacterium]|nr:Hsp20/alpha crystallin family protein [Deltaproteobacteria bacterium]